MFHVHCSSSDRFFNRCIKAILITCRRCVPYKLWAFYTGRTYGTLASSFIFAGDKSPAYNTGRTYGTLASSFIFAGDKSPAYNTGRTYGTLASSFIFAGDKSPAYNTGRTYGTLASSFIFAGDKFPAYDTGRTYGTLASSTHVSADKSPTLNSVRFAGTGARRMKLLKSEGRDQFTIVWSGLNQVLDITCVSATMPLAVGTSRPGAVDINCHSCSRYVLYKLWAFYTGLTYGTLASSFIFAGDKSLAYNTLSI